jgi:hypothetical protein
MDTTLANSPNNGHTPAAGTSDLISLRDLHVALTRNSVSIEYTRLSDLLSQGDIAEMLRATRKGTRLQFPTDAVELLTAFIPAFRQAKMKVPQAPGFLRGFLKRENVEIVQVRDIRQITKESSAPPTHEERLELARAAAYAARPANEVILTAQEAAAYLRIAPGTFRRLNIPPWIRIGRSGRTRRWRLSDILAYLSDTSDPTDTSDGGGG